MGEFISRKDLNKSLVEKVNKDIKMMQEMNKNTQFLSGVITQLNQVDDQYFKPLIDEINDSFSIMKFYLGKDRKKEIINPEIVHIIDKYLTTIITLTTNAEYGANNPRIKIDGKIDSEVLAKIELQELADQMKKISEEEKQALINFENFIQKENGIIAKSSYDISVLNAKKKQLENVTTMDLIKQTKTKMIDDLEKILKQKEKYKIKYKWFVILTPILIIGMIACIVIPLVI